MIAIASQNRNQIVLYKSPFRKSNSKDTRWAIKFLNCLGYDFEILQVDENCALFHTRIEFIDVALHWKVS